MKWSGGRSATAVAATESSGSRNGSQAPDPWRPPDLMLHCRKFMTKSYLYVKAVVVVVVAVVVVDGVSRRS